MNHGFLVLLLLSCALVSSVPLDGENVKYVQSMELNFVAALAHVNENFSRLQNVFCSGALVSSRHILTNEHCVDRESLDSVVVFMGSFDLDATNSYKLCDWYLYHDWIQKPGQPLSIEFDDIAIIKLCKEVPIRPAVISWETYESIQMSTSHLIMAGWGLIEDNAMSKFMRRASIQLYDETACHVQTGWRSVARGRYLCTRSYPYILAGDGDSGSPLLDQKNRIVGVTSGVFMRQAMPHKSINMHANVTYYKNFINAILNDNSNSNDIMDSFL
ncbi:hypothetical protein QAD02_006632 [Eretmocerus hayati]|uniref:Uncharacterized protein n=1 Tax=Eretmocerus hayati TaxID=131215 RepID=A0ACC2N1D6_9HYME|nr:hypothetical protein QAD02_006632 [Eretmocerus hayati]